MKNIFTHSFLLASALALGGCPGDTTGGSDGGVNEGDISFQATFADLPALGDGYIYEGWVIADGEPVTTGRFDSTGEASQTVDQSMPEGTVPTKYVLTIEPATGDDPAPSSVHVLGGDISDGAADLSIGHADALGDDLTGASGQFVLAAPSSAAEDDDANGIWFITMPGPMAGLSLPALPAGWAYEGWVVGDNGPVSTGTFTGADMADSNGAGPTAGPEGTPPFPGEDFIDPAVDLSAGHTAVISIEPSPDDSAAPFQLKPLLLAIDGSVTGSMNPYTLDNVISTHTISGSVSIE